MATGILKRYNTLTSQWEPVLVGATGADGADGADGTNGADGTDGRTILYGTAAPTTEGQDGDFYIRTTTNFIYGPKAAGIWPAGTSLVGPAGADGADGADGSGVPAGGTTGQLLAKASETDGDVEWVDPLSGGASDPLDLTTTGATAPGASTLRLFRRELASREFLATMDDHGTERILQTSFFHTKIAQWTPTLNATTAPGVFGLPAITTGSSDAAKTIATTNRFTRVPAVRFSSAATTNASCNPRFAVLWPSIGSGSNDGTGFTMMVRFGIADAASVSTARMFVGMRNLSTSISNADPSTFTNCIGVGHNSAHTNLYIMYGGSSAQTPIDLGANFPITGGTDFYDLILHAPWDEDDKVYYTVTRLFTGHVASGSVSGGSTVLPPSSDMLTPLSAFRGNGTAGGVVAMDIAKFMLETND